MELSTKEIPYGDYCYTILSIDKKNGIVNTKNCPYWTRKPVEGGEFAGYCEYLQSDDVLIDDQCKCCNINMYEDDPDFEEYFKGGEKV